MPLPDQDTLSTYGGLGKVNYQAVPPANPYTDWDNTLFTNAISNVAGLSLVAPRAIVKMTLGTSTGALVLNSWYAVWQNVTPTSPVLTRTGTGEFSITFPTMVSDEYNASLGIILNHTVNLTCPCANLESASGVYSASCSASGNVILVKMFNTSGANDFSGLVLDVFCR